MATEKWRNTQETTLTVAYTAGGLQLTVASAAGFPTVGTFRVRLDNTNKTVWRVNSVAGNQFNGLAESNDGDALNGATVSQVISRAGLERLIQSPETGEARAPTGVDGGSFAGPLQTLTALDQSGWSWVNQGGATINQAGGNVYMLVPAAGGTNLRCRFAPAAPTPPYVIEAGIIPWFGGASAVTSLMLAGIAFRESGTGKISSINTANFHFSSANQPPAIWAANYNSATSANAVIGIERNIATSAGNLIWVRMADNNVNLIFDVSLDHFNWYNMATIGRTSFMAGGPNQVGIVATNQAGGTDMSASWIHWGQT